MRLTIIHPAIGHRIGERYIRSWQMEPLPPAMIMAMVLRVSRLTKRPDFVGLIIGVSFAACVRRSNAVEPKIPVR